MLPNEAVSTVATSRFSNSSNPKPACSAAA
ncbi:hypothetical protein J2750_002214 [Methanococcoides alaskense]|uniref:Uncharacterized protein n=1 Tax=Methanococcoides alaskense TaxID=325778 RepID=A0AA90U1R9_9EURY|nr:hypothetical protein [Methanococcoides alaskense]